MLFVACCLLCVVCGLLDVFKKRCASCLCLLWSVYVVLCLLFALCRCLLLDDCCCLLFAVVNSLSFVVSCLVCDDCGLLVVGCRLLVAACC